MLMDIKVKFLARGITYNGKSTQFSRMLPGSSLKWGNCLFSFDIDDTDYDWLVVYHDIPGKDSLIIEQPVHCPRDRTILVTPEPSSITVYGRDYVKQFGMVITFQEPWALPHPNRRYRAPGLIWYYAYSFEHDTCDGYDKLLAEQPEKTRLLSTMCSTRTGNVTLHSKRLDFSRQLQKDLPELDVFGHGWRKIDDKAEALRPYRYHIVVENHIAPHHLTEKLPDAFLGFTLPFYHGAPNASDYFPKDSFIPIDITNYSATLDIIKSHIAGNEFEDRLPYIREARKRVFTDLNIFSIVAAEINASQAPAGQALRPGVLRNRSTMRLKNPFVAIRNLSEKVYIKSRHRLFSILG